MLPEKYAFDLTGYINGLIGTSFDNVDHITFDLTPTTTAGEGTLVWNNVDGTLDLGLLGGNVTLQIGQELVTRVVNKTSANLLESQYRVVRIDDAQGQRLAVKLAQANTAANSNGTLGVVTENILNNQEGFITTYGVVREINTTGALQGETWNDGDILYLSPTVPGGLTIVPPVAPNHRIIVAYVEYAHANHGKIFVRVEPGEALSDLHDVHITSTPSNGQVLTYDAANLYWKPTTPSTSSIQLFKNSTLASVTGTLTQTILQSVLIPANTFVAGDVIEVLVRGVKSGTAGTNAFRFNINTSLSLAGMTTLYAVTMAAGGTYIQIERAYNIINATTNTQSFGIGSTLASDTQNSSTAVSTLAIDWTVNQYFFVTGQLANTGDTFTSNFILIKQNK